MRMAIVIWCTSFIIGFAFGWHTTSDHPDNQEFEIYQSYSNTCADYSVTLLYVIIPIDCTDYDLVFEDVKKLHDKLNGPDDKLIIKLYYDLTDLCDLHCIASRTYIK